MKEKAKEALELLKETFKEWSEDKAPRLGAALAYYTVFSIAPLLIILISVVGLVYGQEAASGQIKSQIEGAVGPQVAEFLQTMIVQSSKPGAGIIGTVVGLGTLLMGAAGVFGQLKDALNTVWEAEPPKGRGVWGMVRSQGLSFLAVLGTGLLLLVLLVLSAAVAALGDYLSSISPSLRLIAEVGNLVVSFGLVTLLFAMLYKVLPDLEVSWSDVWVGALVTSLLFVLGKLAIGVYLGVTAAGSTYGAAGALVVLLLWVYYSAQILFFGAEFTQVYARRYGSRLVRPETETAPEVGQPAALAGSTPGKPSPAPVAAPLPAGVTSPVAAFLQVGYLPMIVGVFIGLALGLGRSARD